MWFCYDGECFETYETPEKAKAAADKAMAYCRNEAADGWPEETESICWGKVLVHAKVTMERPATEDEKEWAEWDTYQEIELVQLPSIEPTGCPMPGACSCPYPNEIRNQQ